MNFVMKVISSIRNIKADLNISPKKDAELICRGNKNKTDIILNNKKYFSSLIKIKNIDVGENISKPAQASTAVINDVEIFLPLADLINLDKEINRLKLKISDVEGRLNAVKSKLDNKNFVQRAPKEIVNHEQKKYDNYKNDYDKLVMNLNSLSS